MIARDTDDEHGTPASPTAVHRTAPRHPTKAEIRSGRAIGFVLMGHRRSRPLWKRALDARAPWGTR